MAGRVLVLVSDVVWPGEGADAAPTLAARLEVPVGRLGQHRLVKKSLDARHRRQVWRAVYRVEVDGPLPEPLPKNVRWWTARDEGRYGLHDGAPTRRVWPDRSRCIVVGAGPAGLFAALYLAEAGADVVLLERGAAVDRRVKAVNGWWRGRAPLDPETNLVFGEGGAGTFSDGKIYTRRRDGELGFIFRRLIDFGADPAVMQEAWAHLGTDRIRALLPPFRRRLEELGAEVRFDAKVERVVVESGRCRGVVLEDGGLVEGTHVLVGVGHSARDALRMLVDAGARAEPRGIAVGARVEHPQELIDQARYGREDRGGLPAASYRLAFTPKSGRAAHTFCMCPGGMVVPANNQAERVVVNGMSFAARRAFWANSAVIVHVGVEDFVRDLGVQGTPDPLIGFAWQDAIEARAFAVAGEDYRAPAQRVTDLLRGRASADLPRVSYPFGVTSAPMSEVFPTYLVEGLQRAVRAFDADIPGFAGADGVLIAPETRTTSPVRFLRDEAQCSVSVDGLFPIGEGAGHAGGIVSSALDGLRAARAIALATGRA